MFSLHSAHLRGRLSVLYGFLIIANLAAWAWAFCSCREHPSLLGTAFLAYCLGMRHAVDADHIAAIDNVTRKLIQDGGRPIGVGFWFAFSHSTVVFLATLAIALTTLGLPLDFDSWFASWKGIGATVRSSIATSFLFVVAALNLVILADIWKTFRRVRKDGGCDVAALQNRGGVLAKIFQPLFRLVTRDWHMLLLGFLFALGFDTVTEIGLLGISGAQAGQGMSIWLIMVFPVLFAAGMALIDTTDGVLMLGAYNWAFVKPAREFNDNLVITAVSVAVASAVGGVQALGLVGLPIWLARRVLGYDRRSQRPFQRDRLRHCWRIHHRLDCVLDDVPVRPRRRVGADCTERDEHLWSPGRRYWLTSGPKTWPVGTNPVMTRWVC